MLAALEILGEEQTLDRYELLTPIGRGGMAVVWAARLRGTRGFSKIVAVKTMLPVLSADPRFESMFLAEANIASRIKHPNVCPILDVGEDRGVLFLVMDWVDGEPLSSLLDGGPLPYDVAAYLIAQAARGLQAAHDLRADDGAPSGVVHRDVSPQNILVTSEALVQIVDFGIAKTTARSDQRTDTGFIKGKVSYLAPEQVEHGQLDARADIFALGVVLYELTTGRHPFRGATDLATLLEISCPDPAPAPPQTDYPETLRAVLDRALAKDRDARYGAMRELASDLEAFVAQAGSGADRAASYVSELLHDHRVARAESLKQAAFAADSRVPSVRGVNTPLPVATDVSPRRPLRPMLVFTGAVAIGILAGAIGVRAAQRPAPAAATVVVAAPTTEPPPSASPSAPPAVAAPTASTAPSPARAVPKSALPRAATPPPSAPVVAAPTAATPPIFRQPGF